MQLGTGGCVLKHHFLVGKHERCCAESRQCGFMKTRQNELFFAGVGVDVTHREDAGNAGGEFFGVHHELLAFDLQPPIGDRTEFCLLYTSPSPRDKRQSRMPSSA